MCMHEMHIIHTHTYTCHAYTASYIHIHIHVIHTPHVVQPFHSNSIANRLIGMRKQWLRAFVLAAAALGPHFVQDLDAVDGFSGSGAFGKYCSEIGWTCAAYDLQLGNDCTTETGMIDFFKLCLRCKAQAIILIGPPCQFFIYLSRRSHGKTIARPSGNNTPFSVQGNRVALFVAAAIWVCNLLSLSLVIEQPQTSVLWYNKFVKAALRKARGNRVSWRMGALGSETPKPSVGFFLDRRAAAFFRAEVMWKLRLRRSRLFANARAYGRGPGGDLRANRLTKRSARYPRGFCKLVIRSHLR